MKFFRRLLFALFAIGGLGTGAELLLLGHTEDRWQLVPLVLLGLGLFALVGLVWRPGSVRVFRVLMVLFVVSGVVGVYLHYRANAEFEIEMYPSIAGIELVREALTGALPALAPATMLHLGLLGLASTYRYPEGDSQ
jgi:hypothetical protein